MSLDTSTLLTMRGTMKNRLKILERTLHRACQPMWLG